MRHNPYVVDTRPAFATYMDGGKAAVDGDRPKDEAQPDAAAVGRPADGEGGDDTDTENEEQPDGDQQAPEAPEALEASKSLIKQCNIFCKKYEENMDARWPLWNSINMITVRKSGCEQYLKNCVKVRSGYQTFECLLNVISNAKNNTDKITEILNKTGIRLPKKTLTSDILKINDKIGSLVENSKDIDVFTGQYLKEARVKLDRTIYKLNITSAQLDCLFSVLDYTTTDGIGAKCVCEVIEDCFKNIEEKAERQPTARILAKCYMICRGFFRYEVNNSMLKNLQESLTILNLYLKSCKSIKNADDTNELKFRLGHFFQLSNYKMIQGKKDKVYEEIMLKIDSPEILSGASLYFVSDVPIKIHNRLCTIMYIPLAEIKHLQKNPATFDFQDPLKSLIERKITVVTEKPEIMILSNIQKFLDHSKWVHTDTIDWWLAYWCDLYKKTTIFTGLSGQKLTESELLKDKIVCTSSSWYSTVHERNQKNNIRKLNIFLCTKLLIPINVAKDHWVLAFIQIDRQPTRDMIIIEWYDSLNDGYDIPEIYPEKTKVLTDWLTSTHAKWYPRIASAPVTRDFTITSFAAPRTQDQTNGSDNGDPLYGIIYCRWL
jgi:hypothetical protein